MAGKQGRDLALSMLRTLPRVCLNNIRDNPGARKPTKRGRGQHGGNQHGTSKKGSGHRQNFMRPGYETGNNPFYLRFSREPYYKGHHLRREYPPLSLQQLQMFIDTNRIDSLKPIDLVSLINTGLYNIKLEWKHAGVHLTDEGADNFKAKVNIEVQWASEPVIAAIEKNGGTITTAYYDSHCLYAVKDVTKFFSTGEPIPRRLLPPTDCLEYYTSAATRGYLANPEEISYERLVLAQKYGYELSKIEDDPDYEMLIKRKDPRQLFYGLAPGWVVSLKDKAIFKPKAEYLKEFYSS
ncbi:39S ribosomal protein L15, mitochondrial [Habropoda laboriosa]|uniref:Large ribosomal subunit protein uL15m n=1 Tax=Habropoda laboriosa TaxID=597456 RepID=A0A0L7R3C9_9HYME|nr:PREDICTED: 39S ribosomal protein L15, mitochondrial [Habropoda laboriosa]KOC65377.1 39S ribosomal protein L15, mitochondrial [Habropoda laboriosa]